MLQLARSWYGLTSAEQKALVLILGLFLLGLAVKIGRRVF
jgi:hypothetical protein